MEFDQALPIDAVLPALTAALAARNVAVLVAPPGAGKSTRVPPVLAEEPGAAHIVGRSRDVALIFFEDVLAQKPTSEKSGFIGDLKAKTFQPMGDGAAPNYPTAWLPTARVARAWQALVTEQPFDR